MNENQSNRINRWFYILSFGAIAAAYLWSYFATAGDIQRTVGFTLKVCIFLAAIAFNIKIFSNKRINNASSFPNQPQPSSKPIYWYLVVLIVAPLAMSTTRCVMGILPFSVSANSSLVLMWYLLWMFIATLTFLGFLILVSRTMSAQTSRLSSFFTFMSVPLVIIMCVVEYQEVSSWSSRVCIYPNHNNQKAGSFK